MIAVLEHLAHSKLAVPLLIACIALFVGVPTLLVLGVIDRRRERRTPRTGGFAHRVEQELDALDALPRGRS